MFARCVHIASQGLWRAFGLLILLAAPETMAFQLSPSGTSLERHNAEVNAGWYTRYTSRVAEWGVHNFTHSVHEEITHLIFGCDADPTACAKPDIGYADQTIIAGVRWNDDPPFGLTSTRIPECKQGQTVRVVTQPICWYKLFTHAEKRARTTYFDGKSNRWNIMYRSHFGDLQFLHAMGSRDGETAGETRRRILMWAEFTWSVATGIQDSKALLKNVKTKGFADFFPKSGQSIFDLFALGNTSLRRGIRDVAFGSLLHLVEDSFAYGHVERSAPVRGKTCLGPPYPHPGTIRSFRSYTNQNHKVHGHYDSRESFQAALSNSPNVIDVGKVLLGMYDRKEPWETVDAYLQCLFDIEDENAPASAGTGLGA